LLLLLILLLLLLFLLLCPAASAPGSIAACRRIVRARLWMFPLIPPGDPTPTTTRETSSRERENCGREMSGEFYRQTASFTPFEGIFYIP
jgi:hypothetical protein